jgi:hypothetical protein
MLHSFTNADIIDVLTYIEFINVDARPIQEMVYLTLMPSLMLHYPTRGLKISFGGV